jgi:hypothetical protein
MSSTEHHATEADASTVVEEHQETTEQTAGPSARPSTPSGANPAPDGGPGEALGRDDSNGQDENDSGAPPERVGSGDDEGKCKPAGLCHHVMESGFYCQSPALRDRRYCYSHLRLRGERLRMARAIAQRQPYRFDLPALDDLFAVQAAVEHVARALGAGLLERRQAGTLLYALQQSAINFRILALAGMSAASSVNPTLSPTEAGQQKRLAEEYPEFEAEFGLPAGLDLSQPAHVVFPPPEQVWQVVPAPPMVARPHRRRWTKESIELEELHRRREQMSQQAFNEQAYQIKDRISKQAYAEFRKRQEAAWRAEAERRNAAEETKDLEYASMDEAHRRAYHLGVLRGLEAAQEQAEEEAQKKPAAKAAVAS